MSETLHALRTALLAIIAFTVLTGIVYPAVVTGVAQVAFPHQANGAAELVGQPFSAPGYFWGRPSAIAPKPYDATTSSATNLAESNPALHDAVRDRVAALRAADPDTIAPVPVDLVTASASGLDPDISPEAAHYQAARVARARHLSRDAVDALIDSQIIERTLGILGERRVNVVAINRALDAMVPASR